MWCAIASNPGVVHIMPIDDQFEHTLDYSGECWCGAWREIAEGGMLVRHFDISERIQLLWED